MGLIDLQREDRPLRMVVLSEMSILLITDTTLGEELASSIW
jgi:hypothetical protein